MNQQQQNPLHPTLPRATHDALLRQLSVERSWLQAARESLLNLRRCAVVGDAIALETVLREQAVLMATREDLAAARRTILQQVGEELAIRQPATLGSIAARLSPQARMPILAARKDLLGATRSIRALTAGAMAIITQKRLILDGVLGDMLGSTPTESRYTADGQRQDLSRHPLVECRT